MKAKKWLLMAAFLGLAGFVVANVSAYQFSSATMDTDADRNKIVLRVFNVDLVEHEAGDVLVWNDGNHDGLDVSTTAASSNRLVAGVVPYGYTMPANDWGWLQTSGYHPAITMQETATAGFNLVTSTTAEAASVFAVGQSSGAFGVALETSATGSVKGFIRCN